MKKIRIIAVVILITVFTAVSSQGHGNNLSGFLFDEYQSATVYFKDLRQSNEKINYNLIDNQLYFIDRTDQLVKVVSDQTIILSFRIGERFFIMTPNGIRERFSAQEPVLLVQYFVKSRPKSESGGFGGDNSVASITTYSDLRGQGHSFLKSQERQVTEYYNVYWVELNGKEKKFKSFGEFLKLYPTNIRTALNSYILDIELNFDKTDDVIRMCVFAATL